MTTEPTFRDKQFGRIDSFSELKDGWLWGEGKVVSEGTREKAKRFLAEATLPETYMTAPTEDGGVLIEFETPRWYVSVELQPEGGALCYGYEYSDYEDFEITFTSDQWQQLLVKVKEKVEE